MDFIFGLILDYGDSDMQKSMFIINKHICYENLYYIDDEIFNKLKKNHICSRIKRIELDYRTRSIFLNYFTNVVIIKMIFCSVIVYDSDIKNLIHLRNLEIGNSFYITDYGIQNLTKLEVLTLMDNKNINVITINELHNLRHLVVPELNIDNKKITLKKLKYIDTNNLFISN